MKFYPFATMCLITSASMTFNLIWLLKGTIGQRLKVAYTLPRIQIWFQVLFFLNEKRESYPNYIRKPPFWWKVFITHKWVIVPKGQLFFINSSSPNAYWSLICVLSPVLATMTKQPNNIGLFSWSLWSNWKAQKLKTLLWIWACHISYYMLLLYIF